MMNELHFKKGIWTLLTTAVCVSSLLGCAATAEQCDPKNVDFFNNTGCLLSGTYGQRQQGLESTLATEQSRNVAFRAVLAELQAEQTQTRAQLKSRQADYARLDTAWRNLKQSLHGELSANRALAARIEQIDRDLAARKGTDTATATAERTATRNQLQRQIVLLEQELNAGIYE